MLKEIIKQEKYESKENKTKFNRLRFFLKFYAILYFLSMATLLYLQLKGINSLLFQYKYLIGLLVLIMPLIYKIYKSIKIFTYEYKTLFPIYFVKEPRYNHEARKSGNKFIHSKIYIIDDEVAFVGSINFTDPCFFYNYETCLTIKDKETIIKLSNYFDELYQTDWIKVSITETGKKIYIEPIN